MAAWQGGGNRPNQRERGIMTYIINASLILPDVALFLCAVLLLIWVTP
jgi:hypothetical protein